MASSARALVLVGLLAAALGLRVWIQSHSAPLDDAYITYRYARHLAAGHGFVYNPGERVLGTTTPLFTLLLVPAARLGLPLDTTGRALGVLADVLVCALLFRALGRQHRTLTGWLAALFHATFYVSIVACGYGMETQIFMLLVLLAFASGAAGRLTTAALAAAGATLTRPEGLLVTGMLAVLLAFRIGKQRQRLPWRALALYLLVVAGWSAFATAYFGHPVPNSVAAKAAMRWMGPSHWLQFFFLRNPLLPILWVGWGIGSVHAWRTRNTLLMLLAAWGPVYALFFLAGRPSFLAAWYFPPLLLSLLVLSATAATIVAEHLLRRHALRVLLVVGLWLLAMAMVLPRAVASAHSNRLAAAQVYRPLAEWVRTHTTPEQSVFAGDVGYLGYFSDRRILDFSGLVSPEVWRYYETHTADPLRDLRFVAQLRPRVVVLSMGFGAYAHWNRREFLDLYRPVRRFSLTGDTELHPAVDPAVFYAQHPEQPISDYIVYERRPEAP